MTILEKIRLNLIPTRQDLYFFSLVLKCPAFLDMGINPQQSSSENWTKKEQTQISFLSKFWYLNQESKSNNFLVAKHIRPRYVGIGF